jgi:hypothetical protein
MRYKKGGLARFSVDIEFPDSAEFKTFIVAFADMVVALPKGKLKEGLLEAMQGLLKQYEEKRQQQTEPLAMWVSLKEPSELPKKAKGTRK